MSETTTSYMPISIHPATRERDIWLCSDRHAEWSHRLTPCGRLDGGGPNAKRDAKGPMFDLFARELCRCYNAVPELMKALRRGEEELSRWHQWRLSTSDTYASSDGYRETQAAIDAMRAAIRLALEGRPK